MRLSPAATLDASSLGHLAGGGLGGDQASGDIGAVRASQHLLSGHAGVLEATIGAMLATSLATMLAALHVLAV